MRQCIIKAKDLVKTFLTDGFGLNAVDHIDLEIYQEDFTVIMGSSGSGKSSLLYVLSGLDGITSGDVFYENVSLLSLNEKKAAKFRREEIGFVFQAVNLIPNLSLLDNITIAGFLTKKPRKDVEVEALKLFTMMRLSNEKDRLPSMVSGGQAQRAAIARSLINQPKVLFADEPTGSLNSSSSEAVLDVFSKINQDLKKTIIMVTHDIKAAVRADRILFLKDGKIDGDIRLDRYNKKDKMNRENHIMKYLQAKGW
ncbi:ABC transporter ATP-binding protein [Peloplasma aerotolerans]|uniref:ABC transporter ATP-binding protein n=1 Tax=Peloplasma aerotolerans TaxID=3044389 RepID=A0AAW6U5S1_9MOLU|nr:ABC transporter ATP-binding protein [Mariniplasma sp. M4Ah]MDI6453257.1 ABC transporter ATP-binding protein [Mariniplasma sp. M4Ah]